MSLFSILSNATTALLNTQAQINVTSSNIGNAQNPNYTQRNAVVIDKSPQNGGSTQVVDVSRAVDGTLQTNYLGQTTNSGATTTVSQLYTQLEQLTGSSTASPVLSSALQTFQNAWQALQATPEDSNLQTQVLRSAQGLVNTIQSVSHGVEQIAAQVTTQIGTDVATLNTSLSQIATLNKQIGSGNNSGQDTSALQDARDELITTVAGLVPVQQQTNGDGTVYLSTPSGVALVQQSANSFSYDATTDSIYASGDPAKTSLNRALTNGQIGAEIGILANTGSQTASDVNQVNNYLTQVATINAAHAAVPSTETAAQVALLPNLVSALQSLLPSASVSAAPAPVTVTLPTTPPTDLVTGAGTTNLLSYNSNSNTISAVNAPTVSLNSVLTSGTLKTDLQSVPTSVANPNATGTGVLQNLRTQLNNLADIFYNPTVPTAFQAAYNPTPTAAGSSDFFTGTTGGPNDRFTLSVNATTTTLASAISTTPSIAANVAQTFTATTSNFNAGGVSITSTNFLGIANAIASNQSNDAASATSAQTEATANTSAAQQAYRNVTGVSSDQQLAQLVSLQNAYSAAAKIISTVQQLESTLLTAVGGA